MPKTNKLSDAACRSAKPKAAPYKITDGEGLYLLIKPNGSKLWQMKYNFHGREKTFSCGVYPIIALTEAREEKIKAKRLLQRGIDPSAAKQDAKKAGIRNAQNTFKATAIEWYEASKGDWTESYAKTVLSRLERCLYPTLGNRPLASITPQDMLDALRKIEQRGALDVAKRARQIAASVFTYGITLGRSQINPASGLERVLASRKTKHFAAISPDELPELVKAIERNDARLYVQTRNALTLLMLTFVRPGEIRHARWDEFDLDAGTWTIPAEKMKMRRDHLVPLSRQAIAILKEQQELTGLLKSEWVFPGQNQWRKPMSECTLVNALKSLGYKDRHTAHGFRSLARSAIREKLDYSPDIIEKQLAHEPSGSLGAAYDRAEFLPQRRQMMQDWANYIERISGTAMIIPIKKQA